MDRPRIALCHEWVTAYGGSEQVAQRLAEVFDVRDVFTFAADPSLARELFPGRIVHAHRLGLTDLGRRRWPFLLPFMPGAWRELDLSAYDVVLTSSHSCVNAIRVGPDALHVSYCHTPMRYAWEWRSEIRRAPLPIRPVWPIAAAALRRADHGWAQRVDVFVANSQHVAERIRASYGRYADVVYPPVDTSFWTPDPETPRGDAFLVAGRFVAYKRADVAIRAARSAGVRLIVAGQGTELSRLRRLARGHVEFILHPTREELRELYRRARAILNPGVEDFGITMAEAQACGTPVIALDAGGAREIVVAGRTGVLYEDPSPSGLVEAIRAFDLDAVDPGEARRNAERFDAHAFDEGIRGIVDRAVARGAAQGSASGDQ